MNLTFLKCIVVIILCKVNGSVLSDISYNIKRNGIMVRIDYSKPIKDSDIVDWKSDRGWIYITLLGVASNDTKISKNFYGEDIKQIVIDDFDESIQIAILVDKPIKGYDVINYKKLSYTALFIHTDNKFTIPFQAMSLNLNLYLIKPMIQLSRNTILILKMHLIKREMNLAQTQYLNFTISYIQRIIQVKRLAQIQL